MRLTHNQKVKIARRLQTTEEKQINYLTKRKTPLFQSKAWEERKSAIQARVKRKESHENN